MTDLKILSNTDRTSWTRIGMVARYYYPRLRKQIILYPLASLICTIIAWGMWRMSMTEQSYDLLSNILSYMITFGAVAFTFRRSPEMTLSLPACGLEKGIFIMAYTFLVVPVLVMGPYLLFSLAVGWHYDELLALQHYGVSLGSKEIEAAKLTSVVSTVAAMATCLWVAMAARRNAAAYAILAPIGVMFAVGLMTGAAFVFIGFRDGMMGMNPMDVQSIVGYVFKTLMYSMIIVVPWAIFALVKAWRAITRLQY